MKKFYILFVFAISMLLFPFKINANTCSSDEIKKTNNLINNIKITYEYIGNNEFNVHIYNIPEELYILAPSQKRFYYNEENVSTDIRYQGGRSYTFKIYSNSNSCISDMGYTKTIYIKKYNQYSEKEICKNKKYQKFKYCNEWYQGSITDAKFETELKKYEQSLENIDEPLIEEEKNYDNLVKIISIIGIGAGIGIVLISILVVKKRRSRSL